MGAREVAHAACPTCPVNDRNEQDIPHSSHCNRVTVALEADRAAHAAELERVRAEALEGLRTAFEAKQDQAHEWIKHPDANYFECSGRAKAFGEAAEMVREYLGQWPAPDPHFLRAIELWKAYYHDCDAFDGTAGPVHPSQRAASAWFAKRRREQMATEAWRAGISDDDMRDARDRALYEYEREPAADPRDGRQGKDRSQP